MAYAKKADDSAYRKLKSDLREGKTEKLYILWGDERYLLEYYLGEMRKTVLKDGFDEFNHRRFDGKTLDLDELSEAVETLPVFAERTLTEVTDFDVFGCRDEQKTQLCEILRALPEEACLVFVYDTVEFKCDNRVKLNAEIKKLAETVEFTKQEQSDLLGWIARRFKALGKSIDRPTAEYLAFISDGLMTSLVGEIEKVSAYNTQPVITRESIDAVVTPALDAVTYKLTDAILERKYDLAGDMLSDLLAMQEPPHKIIYSISAKMRQLLGARVCLEAHGSVADVMELCGIKNDWQARNMFANAAKVSLLWCKRAVGACTDTAIEMNSTGGDYGECLSLLLVKIASLSGE